LTGGFDKFYRSAEGLVVKSWDEEFAVVYAPSQAKTHLITAAAATVLQVAMHDRVTTASLLGLYGSDAVISPEESDPTSEHQRHLDATLAGLLGAGLLQQTT
jgi:hypothetical protein